MGCGCVPCTAPGRGRGCVAARMDGWGRAWGCFGGPQHSTVLFGAGWGGLLVLLWGRSCGGGVLGVWCMGGGCDWPHHCGGCGMRVGGWGALLLRCRLSLRGRGACSASTSGLGCEGGCVGGRHGRPVLVGRGRCGLVGVGLGRVLRVRAGVMCVRRLPVRCWWGR